MSPELEQIRREADRVTRDASADDWLRAPAGKWNSLQILEHLRLTYTATSKGLRRAMDAGRPEPARPSLAQRLKCIYILRLGRFPPGIEAPQPTVPGPGLGDDPLRRFNDAVVAMDASLSDAEKRFGANTRVLNHPVLGPFTAQAWRRFHQVHGRHHLKQVVARMDGRA